METLDLIATICTRVMAVAALLVALIKPLREWVFGWSAIKEGQRCLLRSDMLHTYYKHKDERKIRQYEAENFARAYKAYKALKGNSFMDNLKKEIDEWEVVT